MTAQQPTPQPCSGCGGTGGRMIDTSGPATTPDGKTVQVTRQSWQTCQSCDGNQGGR